MATIIRGSEDADLMTVRDALNEYEAKHPGSTASLFRENPGAIRVRIIDDQTAGMPRSQRHGLAWKFLESRVGEDLMGEIYQLIILPASELRTSLANVEFENPLTTSL